MLKLAGLSRLGLNNEQFLSRVQLLTSLPAYLLVLLSLPFSSFLSGLLMGAVGAAYFLIKFWLKIGRVILSPLNPLSCTTNCSWET